MPLEQLHIKEQFSIEVYCGVQPRPLTVDFDSGLVNRDPLRLRRRRVRDAVGQSVNPLKDRLKRPIYAEEMQTDFVSLSGRPATWRRTANALTGVPRTLRVLVCERDASRLVNVAVRLHCQHSSVAVSKFSQNRSESSMNH